MFWSFVLPFCVTAICFLIAIPVGIAYGHRRLRSKRWRVWIGVPLLASIAFVPSCVAVDAVMAPFRFRTFHYDSYDDIGDKRVARYMPPAATDITVRKERNGYTARYTIAEVDLARWFHAQWKVRERQPRDYTWREPGERLQRKNGSAWVTYHGPREGNWAGFNIDYHPEKQAAVESTADW